MIILVNNDKDACEACLDAINKLAMDQDITYNKNTKTFVQTDNTSKVVISSIAILRAIKFSKLIGLDVSRAYFFAAKLISSHTDSKKDKLLFGAKLFGLAVLGMSLALPVLSLMSSIALVSFLINLPSYCLAYLIGRIIIPCIKNVIPGSNDLSKKAPTKADKECPKAKVSLEEVLNYILILSVLFLYMPLYIFIPFVLIGYYITPEKLLLHPITYFTDKIRDAIGRKDEENYEEVNAEELTIEAFLEKVLSKYEDFYSFTLKEILDNEYFEKDQDKSIPTSNHHDRKRSPQNGNVNTKIHETKSNKSTVVTPVVTL